MRDWFPYIRTGFWSDERGTSVTEFVMTLPVVIIIFAGIVTLGRLGHETGKIKIEAQTKMWEEATKSNAGSITPRSAVTQGSEFSSVLTGIATTMGGHWGESYTRVKLASTVPLLAPTDPVTTADDIIGDSGYANALTNDGLSAPPSGGGGFGHLLSYAVQISGAIPNAGAGVKYGYVEGEIRDRQVDGFLGNDITMSARYRTLVPPDTRGEKTAWGVAWMMSRTQTDYNQLLKWNSSDLDGESWDVPDYDQEWR
jgi:hypothetical protein